MFVAYHTALFDGLARVGALKPWEIYRADMFGAATAPAPRPPVDSMAAKEKRRQQMEQFRKHARARTAPIKRDRHA